MPRRVLVHRGLDSFDLLEVPAPNEHTLQEVMKSRPRLIPSEDLGLDGELLVVGRETSLASGYIDLLCVARSGDVVLLEFKTGPQNPDFRHALAQLIDYGSDLWRMSVDTFDRSVVQHYLGGSHASSDAFGAHDLTDLIDRSDWHLSDDDRAAFDARLAEVLATGDFYYVVAAQRFTSSMQTSLEYMNATMRFGRFYLIEIVQLEGSDLTAHAAQVVAAPARRASNVGNGPTSRASELSYLANIEQPEYRDALATLFAACERLGLHVQWRSKGFSIGIDTPDRLQPLSIAWGLPPGSHWQGARHLTLGVDPSTLDRTPSMRAAVTAFVEGIGALAGAHRVPTKLNAFTFAPSDLPNAIAKLISELDALVETVAGPEA